MNIRPFIPNKKFFGVVGQKSFITIPIQIHPRKDPCDWVRKGSAHPHEAPASLAWQLDRGVGHGEVRTGTLLARLQAAGNGSDPYVLSHCVGFMLERHGRPALCLTRGNDILPHSLHGFKLSGVGRSASRTKRPQARLRAGRKGVEGSMV